MHLIIRGRVPPLSTLAFAIFTAAFLVASVPALAQQSLWVHVNGNDTGNDCTVQSTPCQTIAHAFGQSGDGDTINIGAGEFTETLSILSPRVVTFRGQGSSNTIWQAHEDGPESASSRVLNVQNNAQVTIENLRIRHGNPGTTGGGIRVSGSELTLIGSRVSDNLGTAGGGIHLISDAILMLENTVVRDNQSSSRAGGIDMVGNSVATIAAGSQIVGNLSALSGGGIYAVGESLTITDSMISGNHAGTTGGGVSAGHAISNDGSDVLIIDSVISSNTSENDGAGVWSRGELQIEGSEIAGNLAGGAGGGVFAQANEVDILSTTIRDNSSSESGGGGITLNGASNARISRSTISGNSGHVWGGGIHGGPQASLTLVNSTISGNSASHGAGLNFHSLGNGPLMLVNTTITDNDAGTNGAAAVNFPAGDSVVIDVRNTIIANQLGNTLDCGNHAVSTGNNLSSDSSCGFTSAGDIANGYAGLLPLYDNGGPTLTHGLLSDSDAVEAGSPAACAGPDVTNVDQRAVLRPQGPQCDIGAFEFDGVAFQIATHYLDDGMLDQPYSQTLTAVGSAPPYGWMVVAGQLPDGLSLDGPSGEISGIPAVPGEFEFRVRVSSNFGSAERDFSIAVGTEPGFTIIHPGDQESGIPFDIEIVDAYGLMGLLDGPRFLTVESDLEGGAGFDGEVEFTDGQAVIEGLVLNVFGVHEIEIDINETGMSWQTIDVQVTGSATLEMEFDGNGSGRVVSVPPGLDCHSIDGGQCEADFPGGEAMAIEALPDEGSQFVEWCVIGEGCWGLDDNPLQFELPGNVTFIAVFETIEPGDDLIFHDRFEE